MGSCTKNSRFWMPFACLLIGCGWIFLFLFFGGPLQVVHASVRHLAQGPIELARAQAPGCLLGSAFAASVPERLLGAEAQEASLPFLDQAKSCLGLVGIVFLTTLALGAWIGGRLKARPLALARNENNNLRSALLESEKMAVLGRRAAAVVHDVNNPLMLIRENSGWITDLLEDEQAEQMVHYKEILVAAEKIRQHVDRAKDIAARMLGLARQSALQTALVPLGGLVDQLIEFLQSEARHKNIRLVKECVFPDPVVLADAGQLQQVLLNLIDNAMDAIGKNGSVLIRVSVENETAIVAIKDSGPGIGKRDLAHLFDPFFTTKALGQGTGLGLFICAELMKTLGGAIECRNAQEGGAEFILRFPLASLGEERRGTAERPGKVNGS